jgi:hypothetical protein
METEMAKASMKLEKQDWIEIQRYYLENSPFILSPSPSKKKIQPSSLFHKSTLLDSVPGAKPFVTKIKYHQESNVLYIGDNFGDVHEFDHTRYRRTVHIDDTPIDINIDEQDHGLHVLGIGNFVPSDEKTGQLIKIDKKNNQKIVIDSLERPVHFTMEDFNGDGKREYLISCFGSTSGKINSGKLSMFVMEEDGYEEKIIKELPGAIKSIVGDFNNDQKPDIMALFAQGQEIISMFLNKGDFEFEEKQLLEFMPLYGSNSFELVDINQDSYPDIITTNGDNGDSSPVFKFYHGVRVFVNDGNYQFEEKYFYPINGASQVLVRDFDNDGDLDMVVLAMYPDLFSWTEETIVHFENKGDFNFEPSYVENEPSGKWILMDVGDVDNDGDYDLILGTNYKVKPVYDTLAATTGDQPALRVDAEQSRRKRLAIAEVEGELLADVAAQQGVLVEGRIERESLDRDSGLEHRERRRVEEAHG